VWVGYDQPRTIAARGYAATLALPLWSRFMASATKQDKPTPFERPATVTAVTICRLSGKRATDACRHAMDLDEGFGMPRSDAYTEYFTRGTEPIEYCDWHTYSAPGTIVASPVDDGAAQPAATTGSVPVPPSAAGTQPAPQRRGFWRRLFGLGPPEPSPPRPAPSPSPER
jgi:membrane carboxypeptidase/penicillin-binding protein